MKFKHFISASIVATGLCLQACTTSASDEKISGPSDADFESLPQAMKELAITNYMLDAFYVNADKEVKNFDYYVMEGADHGFSTSDYEYPDVSYMYSTLSDNYTNYFSPAIAGRIVEMLLYSEEQTGIGADFHEITGKSCISEEFCNDSNTLVFKHVYPNGPADRAGLKKGDTLLVFDGYTPRNEQQFRRIEAAFDSRDTVQISVKRGDDTVRTFVSFDQYFTPTVFVDEVDSIPVITITEFMDTTTLESGTYGEFLEALKETEGAEATIIDLRGNPGGSTDQCIDMTSELLPKNDTIAIMVTHTLDSITEKKLIDTATYIVEEDGIAANRYFVILADSGSASCAELMIMGTVSNTKSPIVGLTTYGKGIGQFYMGTYAGGLTGITSMRIFDKDRTTYHKYGIVPDFEEGDSDKAMQKAVELAKEKKAVRTAGYGTVDLGHFTLAKSQSKKDLDRGAFKYIPYPHKFVPKALPTK